MSYMDEYADWQAAIIAQGAEDEKNLRQIEDTEVGDSILREDEACECANTRTEQTELGQWFVVCEDCGHSTLMQGLR